MISKKTLIPRACAASIKVLQFGIGPEMGIKLGHIEIPVAMVASGNIRATALHRVILEDWGHPDSGGAHIGQVIELGGQAGQVAAVEETKIDRIKTVVQPVTGNEASVVGWIAVVKAVGHHEVEDFILDGITRRRRHQGSDL